MFIHEQAAKSWLQSNVGAHTPANTKSIQLTTLTSRLVTGTLGSRVDHAPFTGCVIETNSQFSVVKTGPTGFVIIDPAVLRDDLQEGMQVSVTPYARRRFDGSRLMDPVSRDLASGAALTVTAYGSSVSTIPVETPRSDFGKHLLNTLQRLRCPDGVRVMSNLLVDIGATNFVFVDADMDDPTETRDLQLIFDCTNRNFSGRVTIGMDRNLELFYLEMHKVYPEAPEVLQHRCEGIYLDNLAEVMSTLLCDGEWKFAKIEILTSAMAKQALDAL